MTAAATSTAGLFNPTVDLGVGGEQIEEVKDVGVGHAHAAVGGGGAEEVLPVRAVQVDETLAGMFVDPEELGAGLTSGPGWTRWHPVGMRGVGGA